MQAAVCRGCFEDTLQVYECMQSVGSRVDVRDIPAGLSGFSVQPVPEVASWQELAEKHTMLWRLQTCPYSTMLPFGK